MVRWSAIQDRLSLTRKQLVFDAKASITQIQGDQNRFIMRPILMAQIFGKQISGKPAYHPHHSCDNRQTDKKAF